LSLGTCIYEFEPNEPEDDGGLLEGCSSVRSTWLSLDEYVWFEPCSHTLSLPPLENEEEWEEDAEDA